jgi:hypothetical protein
VITETEIVSQKRVNMKDQVRYIRVPFESKDEAKTLGARWDASDKCWFVPFGVDPMLLREWWAYLDCPFEEKDEARMLGARWDKNQKGWYVPTGVNFDDFERWWPSWVSERMELAAYLRIVVKLDRSHHWLFWIDFFLALLFLTGCFSGNDLTAGTSRVLSMPNVNPNLTAKSEGITFNTPFCHGQRPPVLTTGLSQLVFLQGAPWS